MHNSDLYERYPNILSLFDSGFEDEVISTMRDATGDYVAYKRIYGTNVVFTQTQMGFIYLECVNDTTLQHIIEEYEDSEWYEEES